MKYKQLALIACIAMTYTGWTDADLNYQTGRDDVDSIIEEQKQIIKRQERELEFRDLFLFMGNGPGPVLGDPYDPYKE
jgi:hypothetical protein